MKKQNEMKCGSVNLTKRVSAFLLGAAVALCLTPAAKKKTSSEQKAEETKKTETWPIIAGRLVAPIEVPTIIQEEDVGSFGVEGGIEGGVEGGVIGGVLGGVEGGQLIEGSQAIHIASVQKPRNIKMVKPIYPQIALTERIQDVVIIEAMTDIYGRVRQARVISGHPLLNEAALSAIKQWVYEPCILNGIPKPVIFTATVTFTLLSAQSQDMDLKKVNFPQTFVHAGKEYPAGDKRTRLDCPPPFKVSLNMLRFH